MDAAGSSATTHLEAGGQVSVPLAEPTNKSRRLGKQPVLTAPLAERGEGIHSEAAEVCDVEGKTGRYPAV